jgi:hypothetical protein
MTRQVPISYRLPFACVFDARSKRLSTMPGCRNRRITMPRRQSAEQLHGAMREESKEIIDHGRGRNNPTRFPARATRIDPAPALAKILTPRRAIETSDVPQPLGWGLRAQAPKALSTEGTCFPKVSFLSRASRWARTKRPALLFDK